MLPRVAAVKTCLGNQHRKHIMTKKRIIVGLLALTAPLTERWRLRGRGRLNGEVFMRRNLIVLASVLTIVGGAQAAQAQTQFAFAGFEEPVQNVFGVGVSFSSQPGIDYGITAFYAVPFDNDQIGIEIHGMFAQGSDTPAEGASQDYSVLRLGAYGTARYKLAEDIDLISLIGFSYGRYDAELSQELSSGTVSGAGGNSGISLSVGGGAEYKLGNTSAIRGQYIVGGTSGGSFDIMYVMKL